VLGYGLELKERLDLGERPHFEAEQAKLRGLLLGDGELRYEADYAGEAAAGGAAPFLGVRYALACWLDEVFIADSPWRDAWTGSTLEVALYGGANERAWRFWVQAKKAEARPGTAALEAFLWCVMLGFRGEPPADLNRGQWVEGVRKRVLAARAVEFQLPPEKEPTTHVPVLHGRERFETMVRVAVAAAALAAAAAGFLLFALPAR
jgi:type VI protein secretion system component VasF